MSSDNGEAFEPRPVAERRTVLGEGNLLRVTTVIGLLVVVAGGFSSYQSLRDEIRTRAESNAAAMLVATSDLQRSISETSREIAELRYDITTRTANIVTRQQVEVWIERVARKNPAMDMPPFP